VRLVTASTLIGQLARFAVEQHPYHRPEGLFELVELLWRMTEQAWHDGDAELPMTWFDDAMELERWLHDALWSVQRANQILTAWNTPSSKHKAPVVFVSRYDTPRQEDDFIDLDALLRNVSRETWNDGMEKEQPAA